MDMTIQAKQLIDIMGQISDAIKEEPDGLFGRVIILKTSGVKIINTELDMEFTVPFDDDAECNESEVILYNLSKDTIDKIKKGERLTIEAGYKGDTGVILNGVVSKKKTRWEGTDKKTTLNIIDNNGKKEREIKSISYKKGSTASYILKDLLNRLALPVAVFKPNRDFTYKDKVSVSGGLLDNISKYAKICGASAYICKGKLYVRTLSDGDALQFTASPATGLLSVEEFEEEETAEKYKDKIKGLNLSMLLQHRITTASIIKVKSKNYQGSYRVRSGVHVYNGADFLTELEVVDNG